MKLDYSMISQFETCPKAFYWRYVKHLVPKEPYLPYELGRCVHEGIHKLNLKKYKLPSILNGLKQTYPLVDHTVVEKLLTAYQERPLKQLKIIKAEHILTRRLHQTSPHFYTGRIDAIASLNNTIYLVEYKTTSASSVSNSTYNSFKYSPQLTGYAWLLQPVYKHIGIMLVHLHTKTGNISISYTLRDIKQLALFHKSLYPIFNLIWKKQYNHMNLHNCTGHFPVYRNCDYIHLCHSNEPNTVSQILYKTEVWIPGGSVS